MKSIDFDLVADLYDAYIRTDIDHSFWLARAIACPAPALELMCGTGRITLALLRAGLRVEGLDYSRGLLARFRDKLRAEGLSAGLHEADAREFALEDRYGLIYIGFNAIAEVVDDSDKCRLFERVRAHLLPGGEFWLTLHNPPIRSRTLDGLERPLGEHIGLPGGESLEASARFELDTSSGIVSGEQRFVVSRDGREARRIVQPVRFHLVTPRRIDELLEASGFHVSQRFGDYDGAAFDPRTSPFYVVGCRTGQRP